MGCYEQPAITAITPVMAAPITLSGDKRVCRNMQDHATGFELRPVNPGHADPAASQSVDHRQFGCVSVHPAGILTRVYAAAGPAARSEEVGLVEKVVAWACRLSSAKKLVQ